MSQNNRIVYLSFLLICLAFTIMCIILFISFGVSNPEGMLIIPGDILTEWTLIVILIPLTPLLSGIISIYITTKITIKRKIKKLSKKQSFGLANVEHISGRRLWLRIFSRSLILGFFASNFAYTLAAQETVVAFLRSVEPEACFSIPDPMSMLAILWVLAIPCTFIIIPIWVSNDSGIITSKKINNIDLNSINLSSNNLYKAIKGYAGLGFTFRLIVLLTTYAFLGGHDAFNITMMLLIPLIIIFWMSPIVIYIEVAKSNIQQKVWKVFDNLGLKKRIDPKINLLD